MSTQLLLLLVLAGFSQAQQGTPSIGACPTAALLPILTCISPLGNEAVTAITTGIQRKNYTATFFAMCDADPSREKMNTMLSCLRTPLATCNRSDVLVGVLLQITVDEVEDICEYRSRCPRIVENFIAVGGCAASGQMASGPQNCTQSENACRCIQTQATSCTVAQRHSMYHANVVKVQQAATAHGCTSQPLCTAAYEATKESGAARLATAISLILMSFIAVYL